jgi:hypothetical protein
VEVAILALKTLCFKVCDGRYPQVKAKQERKWTIESRTFILYLYSLSIYGMMEAVSGSKQSNVQHASYVQQID